MRKLVLASAVLWIASATVSHPHAQDASSLGRPNSGVTISLDADGKIVFHPRDLILLEDGRELRRVQGDQFQLISEAEASEHPPDISGLDFLLQASELTGHRVRVTDGILLGASVDRAQLALKGGTVFVRFAGASRDPYDRPSLTVAATQRRVKMRLQRSWRRQKRIFRPRTD